MMKYLNKWRNDESGNGSVVLFLVSFPIVLAIFGIVVDSILYAYAKNAVQSAADSSAVVLASSIELPNFEQQYQSIYKNNLGRATTVLKGGGSIGYKLDKAKRRVCVSVTETVDFLVIDSLPWFSSSSLAKIVIENPGNDTSSGFKNDDADYACAIIK